jgi:phosphate/sulfate permease
MKLSTSPFWALVAVLFFAASIMAFAYGVRVGAGLVGLLALVLIAISIYAQTRK